MKVELLVNLKTTKGAIIAKGSVFSDEYKPLPGRISRLMKNHPGLVRILDDRKTSPGVVVQEESFTMEAPEPTAQEVFEEEIEEKVKEDFVAEEVKEVEEKPKKRKPGRPRAKKKEDEE